MTKFRTRPIVIVGPTASGKTALSLELAKIYDGEIICADSRTVYRKMDIGTAKPSKHDQALVRHHLLDVVGPDQSFTAADFKRLAKEAIHDILARKKVPIVVGGTGLYVDALLFDYKFNSPADEVFRSKLQSMSREDLQRLCREKNITFPNNFHNPRHLIRAIETEGRSQNDRESMSLDAIVVGITTDRETLRSSIIKRLDEMLEQGVMDEARRLIGEYGPCHESMTGSIYRILSKVINGDISLDEAKPQIVKADMSLAKRQMTWFKRNKQIFWSDNKRELTEYIKNASHN